MASPEAAAEARLAGPASHATSGDAPPEAGPKLSAVGAGSEAGEQVLSLAGSAADDQGVSRVGGEADPNALSPGGASHSGGGGGLLRGRANR